MPIKLRWPALRATTTYALATLIALSPRASCSGLLLTIHPLGLLQRGGAHGPARALAQHGTLPHTRSTPLRVVISTLPAPSIRRSFIASRLRRAAGALPLSAINLGSGRSLDSTTVPIHPSRHITLPITLRQLLTRRRPTPAALVSSPLLSSPRRASSRPSPSYSNPQSTRTFTTTMQLRDDLLRGILDANEVSLCLSPGPGVGLSRGA